MNGGRRRHAASVLLVLTVAIWLHQWVPAFLVAAFVLWVVVHHRLEGDRGGALRRWVRRAWPPKTLVLVPLLLAVTLVYGLSRAPLRVRILPLTLSVIALSLVVLGGLGRRGAHSGGSHSDG